MRKIYLLLLLLSISVFSFAQNPGSYQFSSNNSGSLNQDMNGVALDMSTGTTQLLGAGLDDVASAVATIGFTFPFSNVDYTQFSVNSNGFLGLGSIAVAGSAIVNGSATTPVITAFGGDHATVTNSSVNSKVHYKVFGTSPNRVLVVEWKDLSLNYTNYSTATSGGGTFQVLLYETTGVVELKYGAMSISTAYSTGPVIGMSKGSSSGNIISITSSTNTANVTATAWSNNTYTTGAITNLNSTSNGARRVYGFTPPPACTTPSAPTSLVLTSGSTFINGSFTPPSTAPSGYLVIRTTSSTTPTSPVNGTSYTAGSAYGSGVVVYVGSSASFASSALTASTQYYFWIYSYNSLCTAEPVYQSVAPLSGSATTTACGSGLSAGTYTVGNGGNYANLSQVAGDLNSCGIAGPVTFSLLSTYNSNLETFPITFNNITGSSSTNTITIKPAAGVSATIEGNTGSTSNTSIIKLSGTKYLTIDGSNSANGTSRDLTIRNLGTSTTSAVIWLGSASSTVAPIGCTIKNCIIKGASPTTTLAGIFSGGGTAISSTTTSGKSIASQTDITISNNSLSSVQNGVIVHGYQTPPYNSNFTVSGNSIGSETSSEYVGFCGLNVNYIVNGTNSFLGNTIFNIKTTTANPTGIRAVAVFNADISKNNIYSIWYTGSFGYGGKGIDFMNVGTNAISTISNNIISDIRGDGWSSGTADFIAGIRLGYSSGWTAATTGGVKIYNNTVNLTSGSFSGNSSGTFSAAFYVHSTVTGTIDVRNNIFVSNLSNSNAASAKTYSIYSAAPASTFSTINFNNYYISGSQGVLGYLTSDRANLAGIISGFGGNANSINRAVNFTSLTNGHLTTAGAENLCLDGAGTPISTITSDIDGDTRSLTSPDIGADEFSPSALVVTNQTVCTPSTVDLTSSAVTTGSASDLTFTYFTDAACSSSLSTPTAVSTSGTYYIKATNTAGCSMSSPVVVTINTSPSPSISGSASVCANSTASNYSVTNNTGNTYTWSVTGGTITSGAGSNSILITWGAAGAGVVSVTETVTATGCSVTATKNVVINSNPTPVIVGSASGCALVDGNSYSVTNVTGNTYSWSVNGGTITSGVGTNAISVVWGAAGSATVSVTQTITATGCSTSTSANVTVIISPTATSAVVEPVTCASENGQINLTLGGAAGPYTYAWTGTGNGLTATTQNQAAVSTGFYNVTVTAANGCTTSLANIVVAGPGGCFICPTIGSIAATNTIICQNTNNTISVSGLADLGITYGIQFKYSMTPLANPYLSTAGTVMNTVTNANLTGSGTGASTTYSFPTAGTVYVYAILSPTSPDPACRPYLVKSFAVAATPALTDPTDQVLCTGSTTSAVSLVATPSATTSFAWTNSRTSIGLAASGTGNIAAFTATNYSNSPVTATVVVTPTNTESAGGTTVACVGPTQSYTYTVNPIPTVNTVADQNVCAGTAVTLPFSGFVAGTVFEWTNSNTAIGLAASGTGNLSYTATNTTSSPITATLIVTPKYTNAGVTCTGNPISFTITVNPTPTVAAVTNQVLCNGAATTAVAFTGATTGTVYNWTNSNTSIGLAASGTGDIASFTAVNTGATAATATITVTPTYTGAGFTCTGTATTFTITVNPTPSLTAVSNRIICNGSSNAITLTGPVTGSVYSWTNDNTAIGLAASGTGNISFTATNPGPDQITSTITATPFYQGASSGSGRLNYTVYSTHAGNGNTSQYPAAPQSPAQFDALMNTANSNTVVHSSGTASAGLMFANGVSGSYYAAAGQELIAAGIAVPNNGDFYALKATGTLVAAETGTYVFAIRGDDAVEVRINGVAVAAHYGLHPITGYATGSISLVARQSYSIEMRMQEYGGGEGVELVWKRPSQSTYSANLDEISLESNTCTGTPITFTIAVNPSGQVNTVSNQVLCNGSTTSAVTFSTTNNGLISTGGTQTASSGTISVSVPDASAAGATHTIPVNLPTGAVINNMRVTMNMTHTWISDMVINLKAPNGQVLNLFNQHGGSGDDLVNTVVSSTGTTAFTSGSAPFTGTFAATAASGQGPTGNVSNAANFAALYSTPNGNWVLALRDLFGGDLGVLTSWSISIDYTVQGTFGTNMNWTNSTTSIGLGASGTGNIPSFTAVNNGSAPVTSTVTVTPVYFNSGVSCPGTPTTFTYTVNPTPTVNAVVSPVFCAGTPSTVNFSGNATGTVYSWTNSNTAIGLAASGTGSLSFTPTNTGTTPIIATITVTPSFTNGGVTCTGTPRTFTITVNPVGQANAVTSQVLCNGSNTTAVNFATVNGGGTIVAGTPVVSNSGTISILVPDANAGGASHTIPVTLPAGATVTGVSVNFNMNHTWVSDMVFNLKAPNGQILNLVNRRGGAGVNFTNTTISSAGTASLATGAAPFTGTFAADAAIGVGPTGQLSSAANYAALYAVGSGDWTLQMRDYVGGDVGTLTSWSITINYTTLVPAVTSYAWTNNLSSIGLAASGTGNIASFAATNTTAAPVTATVTVTPTYTNAGVGCAGTPISYTYTVNPTPTVNAVSNQTVCRGSNVAAVNFTGATTGTVYNWTNSNTAIGLAASGTGNIASFVGTNTTAAPISGTITVTPVYTNAGVTCTGIPRTFTITVNPIPTVNPVANFAACHNTTAAAAFSGATTGTVFNWTNSNPAIGLPASGSGNISFTALNTTSAPVTATITVTPSFTNGGTTCVGTPTSFVITVNPLPVVTTGALPGRICISDTLVRLNGTPVGGSWSGFGISGFNFMPPATDVGTWPITYTYADANGCVNSASTTVTVLACEERNRDLDNGAVILYPNPNSGQFNLRVNSTRFNVLGMRVYNAAGQLMYVNQWRGLVFARVIPVNLDHLAAGTYMVRLYYGDGMDRGADKTYQVIIAR